MPRFIRYEVHPENPQSRLLQGIATQIRAGAIVAVPSAAGYGMVCRLDDKAATERLRRCADSGAPAALVYRDLAQAAIYLQVGDLAFRAIRAAGDGRRAFVLRSTRRVPRRLTADANGASLLHFSGHVAAQGLLALLDEPLLIALPRGGVATSIDQLPAAWQGVLDVALDVGELPTARAAQVIDLDGILEARPSLLRWASAMPALA